MGAKKVAPEPTPFTIASGAAPHCPATVTTLLLKATSTRRQLFAVSAIKRLPVAALKARPHGLLNFAEPRNPSAKPDEEPA